MDNLEEDLSPVDISEQVTVEEPEKGPILLLESSFILAYVDDSDPNHKAAASLVGFVTPHNCRFHIPLLVVCEVISKLIHKKKTVAQAIKIYEGFINILPGSLFSGSELKNVEDVMGRYKEHARKELKDLQSNDFIIVTEGIIAGSNILTCDYEMYKKAKKYHKDVYFVATDSDKYEDGLPSFVTNLLKQV